MAEPLTVVAQGTPNPNAAKFILNRVVAARGTTYRDRDAADVPWAKQLLAVPGIVQVFALNDFVSVTKSADAQWSVLGPQVERILRDAFS